MEPPESSPALFTYALMRGDLNMPPGKLAAQAAHCCAQSLLGYLQAHPEAVANFRAAGQSGSRIVLRAPNAQVLQHIYEQAHQENIPCALFYDSGHVLPPHFDGTPILTGLGLGPAPKAALRPWVRRLSLHP